MSVPEEHKEYWENKAREGNLGLWELKDKITNLEEQLAAERAKVAQTVDVLRRLFYAAEPVADAFSESLFGEVCATLNQSADALADIRREVARECAETCKGWESAGAAERAIRARFGVTE